MSGHWTDLFSYITGVVRYHDLAYLSLVNDEIAAAKGDHTFFSEWDRGTWRGTNLEQVDWTTVGAVVCKHPIEQGIFLGLWGEILCIGSGNVHQEKILQGAEDSPENRGPMRGIGCIDGKAYAVGMNRQAYRRDDENLWVCIDQSARDPNVESSVTSFEAIDGLSVSEIYSVGRRGEIWLYDGSHWEPKDSPTNIILTNICCAENGTVYVCGRLGTLLQGRKENWELIEHDSTDEDFWGIAWYDEELYLSTMRYVYVLRDNKLVRVDFGLDIPSTCFHLSVADGVLWSIGAKDVMMFDGKQWARID